MPNPTLSCSPGVERCRAIVMVRKGCSFREHGFRGKTDRHAATFLGKIGQPFFEYGFSNFGWQMC